jgi:hypothetical protein
LALVRISTKLALCQPVSQLVLVRPQFDEAKFDVRCYAAAQYMPLGLPDGPDGEHTLKRRNGTECCKRQC